MIKIVSRIINSVTKKLAITISVALFLTSLWPYAAKALTLKNYHNRAVVVYLGDSNILYGSAEFNDETYWGYNGNRLNNTYTNVFLTRPGARIKTPDCINAANCTTYDYWKIKLAEILPKIKPDAIVINLGINDALLAGSAGGPGYSYYGQKIDWLMAKIPATSKVFWTNLPCAIEPTNLNTACQQINYQISQAPNRWPNLTLVNWSMAANTHPEYMNPGQVHYTSAGYTAWIKLVISKLDPVFPIPQD